jgi:hypothetical protein
MNVLFFPGKDTPIKRYVSYFPSLILTEPNENIVDMNILCHSRGLSDAISYCQKYDVHPLIVSMDGINVTTDKYKIISFRPEHKVNVGDEHLYHENIYYKAKLDDQHHPYRIKKVRDKIISILQS